MNTKSKTNEKLKEDIRHICTYHADEGTSGYELSEEQFKKIFDVVETALKELRHDNEILVNTILDTHKKEKQDLIQRIEGMKLEEDLTSVIQFKNGRIIDGEGILIFNQAIQNVIEEIKKK